MKAILTAAALLGACILLAGSSWGKTTEATAPPTGDQKALVEFQKANAGFALDLYGKLGGADSNVFFSPLSLTTAFGMVFAGARGETQNQMGGVFHFAKIQGLDDLMAATMRDLDKIGHEKGCRLDVANRLWAQREQDFLPSYLGLIDRCYTGGLERLDFAHATETARLAINNWVETQTEHRIKDLFPAGALDPDTKLVLTNAVYFKADWETPFRKNATFDAPFSVTPEKKETVRMMSRTGSFGFAAGGGFKMLEIPYAGGKLSMFVLLPDKVDGLAEMEKDLKPETIARTGDLANKEVEVYLPKFKMTLAYDLGSTLSAMGMPLAFDDDADFSGMTGKKDLKISKVVHKAFVAVDEEGTEAAAATGISMKPTAIAVPVQPVAFHADHPFLFVIRENATGGVLFMGRVANPKE